MKISLRQLLGVLAVAGTVLLLLWFLWPSGAPASSRARTARADPRPSPPPPVQAAAAEPAPPPETDEEILERLGIDRDATPHCATINIWNARRVSLMTITQNMKDGQMMFNETELACLTGSPVPEGVLQVADYHVLKPQPPGLSNGPRGRDMTSPDNVIQRVPGARGAGDGAH